VGKSQDRIRAVWTVTDTNWEASRVSKGVSHARFCSAGRIDHSVWGEISREWEDRNGWFRCDGRVLDRTDLGKRDLFEAIGFAWGGDGDTKFNLPDLQGFFLRGVDSVRPDSPILDPDRDERFPGRFGGNAGAKVGSVQGYATAFPQGQGSEFKVESGGSIEQMLPFEVNAARDVNGQNNTVAYPNLPNQGQYAWLSVPPHEHKFVGGNKETRPVNAYVHWIIRFRMTQVELG
jgi:hypothetical protein